MATGDSILASDFNTIRNKVALVLGEGSGQYGYGQVLDSSPETTGQTIGAAEWNELRNDLINIKLHQDGSQPTLTSPTSGGVVYFGSSHPNNSFNTLIDAATLTKFQIAGNRQIITGRKNVSTSSSWSNLATSLYTITFNNATDARHFFNAGGKFQMSSALTGDSSAQGTAWENLLDSVGTLYLGAATSLLKNVYELTDSNQLLYSITDSGAYSTNEFRIYARCNVANNSGATATTFYIYIEWDDNHANPYADLVSGTLSFYMGEIRATGSMLPSGTVTITAPSYANPGITVS